MLYDVLARLMVGWLLTMMLPVSERRFEVASLLPLPRSL